MVNLQIQDGSIYFRDAEGRMPTNYVKDAGGAVVAYNGVAAQEALGTPIFKTGQTRQYSLDLSGGAGLAHYFLSTNYENDLGIEPNNSLRRVGAHGNLTLALSPVLVGASLNFAQSNDHLGTDLGLSAMLGAMFAHPLLFTKPGAAGFYPNVPPQFAQAIYDNSDGTNRFTGSVTMHHRPLSCFSQRAIVGIDYTGEDARALEKFAPVDLAPFALANPTGQITQTLLSSTLASADYSATAKFDLSRAVTSSSSIGGQFYRTETSQSVLGGQNFPGPGVNLVSATAVPIATQQTQVINTTIGGYGQRIQLQ